MNEKYNRKQNDRIWFDINGDGKLSGYGIIKGCAAGPLPPLGYQWIVEVEEPVPFDKTVYPFSHLVVFDSQIKERL